MVRAEQDDAALRVRNLTVLESKDAALRGRVIAIGEGLCIGRVAQDGVQLCIDDRLLSRKHATVRPLGTSEVYEIVDHDSRNGSFVDGARVQRSHVTSGSIIRLGLNVFELTKDPLDVETPSFDQLGKQREALVGRSAPFRRMMEALDAASAGDAPVVLVGEAGAGKSLGASYVHKQSGRKGPLVAVSCGNGPSLSALELFGGEQDGERAGGFFAAARHGSILFEEIDLLNPDMQPKLLDVLRTGKYTPVGASEPRDLEARVLASTGANLEAAVDAGVFERDLYKMLCPDGREAIDVPSLRSRRSDIPILTQHFLRLEEPRRVFDWSATFLEKLLIYDWPLNVRELRTVARRLTMVEDDVKTLRSAHLPKEIRKRVRMPSEDALRASAIQVHVVPSRMELAEMLEKHAGDVQRIAEHYAKDRRHVYRWLSRHDLSASDYRKPGRRD